MAPHCSQVESAQLNKNILLTDTATVDSCPQLEIGNCDVKCTHGSTVGQLSLEEIFYLQSRGIEQQKAKTLLARAFCEDVIVKIQNPSLKNLSAKLLAQFYLEEFKGAA